MEQFRGRARALRWSCALCLSVAFAAHGKEIVLGQSLALTGGGAEAAKQMLEGANCHFQEINKSGGIRGNTVRLISVDDNGQRDKTLENTKRLIETEQVDALFGYTSAAGAQAVFPLLEQTGTPLVGVASGGLGIRDKHRREVFHARASYTREIDGAIELARMSGILSGDAPMAFVYNQDAKANLTAFDDVVKRRSVTPGARVAIDRNSRDQKAAAEEVLKSRPAVVMAITTSSAMAALIGALREIGYGGAIISSSFAGDPLIHEAGARGAGTILLRTVPDPGSSSSKVANDFHKLMALCGVKTAPSANGLEGYVLARVMEEGIRRAGAKVNRQTIITGLESIRELDLGGIKIKYSPTDHNGTDLVEFLMISKTGRLKR